MPSLILHDSSV